MKISKNLKKKNDRKPGQQVLAFQFLVWKAVFKKKPWYFCLVMFLQTRSLASWPALPSPSSFPSLFIPRAPIADTLTIIPPGPFATQLLQCQSSPSALYCPHFSNHQNIQLHLTFHFLQRKQRIDLTGKALLARSLGYGMTGIRARQIRYSGKEI